MRVFQNPILHIMMFQALIEGYGKSKSYIKKISNEYNEPYSLTRMVYYFS